MENDVGYVDFSSVSVSNQTQLWLIPSPFTFTQWFPHDAAAVANGILYSVKDQYSGVIYVVSGSDHVVIAAPQWASFTGIVDGALILSVYSPAAGRARTAAAPATYRFSKASVP